MGNERRGAFVGADAEHPASGTAILSDTDVRFENYEAGEAPDPKVYLTKDGDITSGVALGPLRQNNGTFSMDVPSGTDVSGYNTVTVHCGEFNVGLSSALVS